MRAAALVWILLVCSVLGDVPRGIPRVASHASTAVDDLMLCVMFNVAPPTSTLQTILHWLPMFATHIVLLSETKVSIPGSLDRRTVDRGTPHVLFRSCPNHANGQLQHKCLLRCMEVYLNEIEVRGVSGAIASPGRLIRNIVYMSDDVWVNFTTLARLDRDALWTLPKSTVVDLSSPGPTPRGYRGTLMDGWYGLGSYVNLKQLYYKRWPPRYREILTELYGPDKVATEIQVDFFSIPTRLDLPRHLADVLRGSIDEKLPIFAELLGPVCLDIAMRLAGLAVTTPLWPSMDVANILDSHSRKRSQPLRFLPGVQVRHDQHDLAPFWNLMALATREYDRLTANITDRWLAGTVCALADPQLVFRGDSSTRMPAWDRPAVSPGVVRPDGFVWYGQRQFFAHYEWLTRQEDFLVLHPFKLSDPHSSLHTLYVDTHARMLETVVRRCLHC